MSVEELLRVNRRVQLATKERPRFPYFSLIEDVSEQTLIVDNPMEKGALVSIPIGSEVTCSLQVENAIYSFQSQVLDRREEGKLSLLVLAKPESLDRIQRRQFFRFKAALPLRFRPLDDLQATSTAPYQEALTKDISGGGLLFSATFPLSKESIVDLLIEVPQKKESVSVPCVGRVVVVKGEGREKDYGVEYVLIEEKDREKIVRFIFEEQAKQRRKEMRWVDHLAD